LAVLSILGNESVQYFEQPQLDWELRAAPTPYDGLQELLFEYQPGIMRGVNCVDVAAFAVALIDNTSAVNGEKALIVIRKALSASPTKIAVGYRILEKGKVVKRARLDGNSFVWTEADGVSRGTAEMDVPRASIIHASVSYNGVAQQHYFFGEPNCFQNPRRTIYEAFDPKCVQLNEILAKTRSYRPAQREFDGAMPWLFWMLGFAPAHIGGVHTDAADFVITAPNGHVAVVECTIGILKEGSKLAKVHARTQAVRKYPKSAIRFLFTQTLRAGSSALFVSRSGRRRCALPCDDGFDRIPGLFGAFWPRLHRTNKLAPAKARMPHS
jgi:hypothetical protein